MITLGKRDSLHTRRQAAAFLMTPDATKKLFADLAPRFADRPGGYTRIVRTGWRIGDGAELAILEFIGSELKKKEKKTRKAAAKRNRKKRKPPQPKSSPSHIPAFVARSGAKESVLQPGFSSGHDFQYVGRKPCRIRAASAAEGTNCQFSHRL